MSAKLSHIGTYGLPQKEEKPGPRCKLCGEGICLDLKRTVVPEGDGYAHAWCAVGETFEEYLAQQPKGQMPLFKV